MLDAGFGLLDEVWLFVFSGFRHTIALMGKNFYLKIPARFSFANAVRGHGWYDLLPFSYDEGCPELRYTFAISQTKAVTVTMSHEKERLRVSAPDDLSREVVINTVSRMFRLDEAFDEFYEVATDDPGLAWTTSLGAGRLLRSATVFEDLIKTICTTNCSWSLTRKMVANLTESIGAECSEGNRAFPTAEAMAAMSPDFYRNEIRAGYRSDYLAEVAEGVASRMIDPESWLISDLPTPELKKELLKVKGIGTYAAEHLLKLLGRYDGLALDSWLRARFAEKHNGGRPVPDKKIARHYKKFGKWQGLALWCDMTEDWFSEKN
jgi:3-methyladenine DNA glycosylase/8-oxoguanine DNA glycosylase